jgi:hypothetical protein
MDNLRNPPSSRPLKVYAFDPTRGRALGNFMTIKVPYESLMPGPVGSLLEVVDYDATTDTYHIPVDLDDPKILLRNGLDPNESDPQFHQQMVYAVASKTIGHFKAALGRPIRWTPSSAESVSVYRGKKLRILPHAMSEANAYYDPSLKALLFGYFCASKTEPGLNLPGQLVFTCSSHDIIAHETTHALIDGQRDHFDELTSPDAPAFHESFADIVALFQHFSYEEALLDVIRRTGGKIYRAEVEAESKPAPEGPAIHAELTEENPLVGLAKQFGDAMGMRKALRSALGTPPNSKAIEKLLEPHSRGSILVAAVFDAFFSVYVRRTADLMRIARAGGGLSSSGDIHPDLANRLAKEAAKAADHFLNICIRAIDYMPVVDPTFGDFLRAIITADSDLVDDDRFGYRAAFIDAFRSRGIVPEGVSSYAEEALMWRPPEAPAGDALPKCVGLRFDDSLSGGPEANEEQHNQFWKQVRHNKEVLNRFRDENRDVLGLSKDLDVKDLEPRYNKVHRVSPDGALKLDVVCQLIQQREVLLDPADLTAPKFKFIGGTTLILCARDGTIRYAIKKPIGDVKNDAENARLKRQRDYLKRRAAGFGIAAYSKKGSKEQKALYETRMNFSMIHRGY